MITGCLPVWRNLSQQMITQIALVKWPGICAVYVRLGKSRKKIGEAAFVNFGSKLWHTLPADIRQAGLLNNLKRKLKTHSFAFSQTQFFKIQAWNCLHPALHVCTDALLLIRCILFVLLFNSLIFKLNLKLCLSFSYMLLDYSVVLISINFFSLILS